MRPERQTLVLLLFVAVAATVAIFVPAIRRPTAWLAGAAASVLLVDAVRGWRTPSPEVTRSMPTSWAIRNPVEIVLRLENGGNRALGVELFDHHPAGGVAEALPRRVNIPVSAAVEVPYVFRPLERGRARFGRTDLRIDSPWGFWQRLRKAGEPAETKVYPDFRAVQRYAILAVDNAVSRLGIKRKQRRGEGLELHQLREYRDGDSLRQIDWKATSRRSRVISREYEDERNQQVVFLLDCGRNMRAADGPLTHFDYALNAVLLLTYIAVRQGDGVGLMTMGGPERWLPTQNGPVAMRAMLETVYDLDTGTSAPDFTTAATRLMARQRRRALIVVVTNLRDEDGEEIAAAVRLMQRRHLVLVASLREAVLDEVLSQPVDGFDDALAVGALHHYLAARRRHLDLFIGRGLSAVDVVPERLHLALVNRYLDIKRTGSL